MTPPPVLGTLTARTRDGVEVRALLTEPAAPPRAPRASVLCLPAMGVTARYYRGVAAALAARGLAVACLDLRGNGDSDVRIRRGADFGYWQHVWDVDAAAAALRRRFPDAPLLLLGHSLGGQLGALQLATSPGSAAGLVLVAAGTPYWRTRRFPEPLRVLAGTQTALLVATALGYFPGNFFGFGGTQPAGVIRDWAALSRHGRFDLRGADRELEPLLAQVTVPVLSISLADDWYSPRRAADHLVGKLTRAPVERRHVRLPDDRSAKSPHFRWTRHPDAIVPLIEGWMTRHDL
ncbi:MAG: alpha/beta fold hydrolase [bacterium]